MDQLFRQLGRPTWLLLATALGSCALGPNYQRPSQGLPATFTRSLSPLMNPQLAGTGEAAQRFSVSDVPGRWWELFGSAEINSLVEQGLAKNADLQSAQSALRTVQENHRADKGALLPQIEGDFSANRQKNPTVLASPLNSNANVFSLNTGQLSITYAPDLFGSVRRQIETSGAEVDNQRFTLQAAYLTLTTNIVLAALQDASLRAQIHATQQSITTAVKILETLRGERRLGEVSAGDVAVQEAALAQAQFTLSPLQKQLTQQEDLLAVLMGGYPSQTSPDGLDLALIKLPADLPLSLPAKLLEQRPDILAAEANLHAASAQVGIAMANRLPNITLTGLLGGTSTQLTTLFAPGNTLWSITGGITQPIFEGGALRHKQRAAEAAYDQSAAQYRSTIHNAFQNVADVLAALDQDARALALATRVRQATTASVVMARRSFSVGEINSAAVLVAEQTDEAAELVRIQAEAARYSDTVALFQALGGGWWNRTDIASR